MFRGSVMMTGRTICMITDIVMSSGPLSSRRFVRIHQPCWNVRKDHGGSVAACFGSSMRLCIDACECAYTKREAGTDTHADMSTNMDMDASLKMVMHNGLWKHGPLNFIVGVWAKRTLLGTRKMACIHGGSSEAAYRMHAFYTLSAARYVVMLHET